MRPVLSIGLSQVASRHPTTPGVEAVMRSPRVFSKYRAKRTEYGGVVYHSKKEAEYAQWLDIQGIDYSRQERYPLVVNGFLVATYIADFLVADGVVEVKGYWTPVAKLKWKLFCALYPDLKKKVVT